VVCHVAESAQLHQLHVLRPYVGAVRSALHTPTIPVVSYKWNLCTHKQCRIAYSISVLCSMLDDNGVLIASSEYALLALTTATAAADTATSVQDTLVT
jgi:hypothetical protein